MKRIGLFLVINKKCADLSSSHIPKHKRAACRIPKFQQAALFYSFDIEQYYFALTNCPFKSSTTKAPLNPACCTRVSALNASADEL